MQNRLEMWSKEPDIIGLVTATLAGLPDFLSQSDSDKQA